MRMLASMTFVTVFRTPSRKQRRSHLSIRLRAVVGPRRARVTHGRSEEARGDSPSDTLESRYDAWVPQRSRRNPRCLGCGLTRSEEHTSELQSRFGISYAV